MPAVVLGRCLTALVVLLLTGMAAAQCAVGPDTAEVTLPEFLAVYYQDFRSDPEDDRVEFYGGVCVTAVGGAWTVTAEQVTVTGLTSELALHSDNPTLYLGEWQITAEELDSTIEELTLIGATVVGPDFSGNAELMTVDLITSEMNMVGLELNSLAFAVRGEGATLQGEVLSVTGAGVTTCIGLETPPYELEGVHAEVNLSERRLELSGGMLRIGGARLPLQERIVISEESLATFTLPVRVQTVSGAASRPGTGLGVRVVGVPLEDEVTIDIGATGIDTEHKTGAVALVRLDVERDDNTEIAAVAGLEAGRPFLDIDLERPLTSWLSLVLGARSGALPGRDARHEALTGLNMTVPLTAARGTFDAELFSAMTVLAPATAPTTTTIAGSRIGGAVNLTARTANTPAGTVALSARAEVTSYPAQKELQWGVRFTPSWSYNVAPLTASLAYDARLTNSASPFGPDVDRLSPLSRAAGTVRLSGELERWEATAAWNAERPPVLSGFLQFRGVHDQVATNNGTVGWQVVNASTGLSLGIGKWDLSASMVAETAGLLNPPADLDAYTLYRLSAKLADWPVVVSAAAGQVLPHGDFEVGIESEFGLVDDRGLRRLELYTGVPFAFPTFELRPYLAFDFAPTVLDGMLPMWSAHGLDVTFVTCCGSFTVGYLNDRGDWSASLSVDLERRPVNKPQ